MLNYILNIHLTPTDKNNFYPLSMNHFRAKDKDRYIDLQSIRLQRTSDQVVSS